jgi:3-hydroxyacyl-[acyl-carrier protein] dehydratase/trans-2-decenoyl-[acyl-carrier protein] isomerase
MRSKLWCWGSPTARLSADGEIIYRAKDLKVGLFKQEAPAALQPGT